MRAPSPIPALAVLAATLALASQPLPAAPPAKGFEGNFALLKTRNIFDPQRQPGKTASAPAATPAVTRADFAALTGILVTPEKTLAFFSGSRPEYNTVLQPEATIAGAKIKRIAPDFIEIDRDGKTTAIAVGQTVPLDASSKPGPAPTASASKPGTTSSTPSTSTPSASASTAAAPAPAPNREALIRHMMEKRQKELR